MKIRNRIPLVFTFSATMVLLGMSLFVYYYSASFRQTEFRRHLDERVDITEKLYLEEDNLPADVYQDIRGKFLRVLPEETEEVGLVDTENIEKLLNTYSVDFINRMLNEGYAEYNEAKRQGVGRVYHAAQGNYWVIVTAVDQDGIRKMVNLRGILIVAGFIGVGLIFLIAFLEARQLLKPISDKIYKANRISASNLHLRLNVYNEHNEIGELALTFNHMLDRLQAAFDMQRSFISNASHEIKNPLTAIIGEADVALEKPRSPAAYQQSLQTISEEADRLNMLVTNLLSLAKTGFEESQIMRTQFRLDELLLDIVSDVQLRNPEAKIKIDFSQIPEDPDELQFEGNPQLLRIAFLNLLENACKFSDNQEVILNINASENLQVKIIDQGVGIPEVELSRITEPFYRAPNARSFKGFGIGLALTDKIISLHHAKMKLSSVEGSGTTVTVNFGLI